MGLWVYGFVVVGDHGVWCVLVVLCGGMTCSM